MVYGPYASRTFSHVLMGAPRHEFLSWKHALLTPHPPFAERSDEAMMSGRFQHLKLSGVSAPERKTAVSSATFNLVPTGKGAYSNPSLRRRIACCMEDLASESRRVITPAYYMRIHWKRAETGPQHLSGQDVFPALKSLLERLGLSDHQAYAEAHCRDRVAAVLLLVNRVHPKTSTAWATWQDRPRIRDTVAFLEQLHTFDQTGPVLQGDSEEKTDVDYVRDRAFFRSFFLGHLADASTWDEIDQILRKDPDRPTFRVEAKTNGAAFVSWRWDEDSQKREVWYSFAASDIDRSLSRPKLEEAFGRDLDDYVAERRQRLEEAWYNVVAGLKRVKMAADADVVWGDLRNEILSSFKELYPDWRGRLAAGSPAWTESYFDDLKRQLEK